MAFNSAAERAFLQLTYQLLEDGESLTPSVLFQEATIELNISVQTARRYFQKHSARRATLGVNDAGYVYRKH